MVGGTTLKSCGEITDMDGKVARENLDIPKLKGEKMEREHLFAKSSPIKFQK